MLEKGNLLGHQKVPFFIIFLGRGWICAGVVLTTMVLVWIGQFQVHPSERRNFPLYACLYTFIRSVRRSGKRSGSIGSIRNKRVIKLRSSSSTSGPQSHYRLSDSNTAFRKQSKHTDLVIWVQGTIPCSYSRIGAVLQELQSIRNFCPLSLKRATAPYSG